MLNSVKSEFRKLLSVRSTYAMVLIGIVLIMLFAGFGDGYKASSDSLRSALLLAGDSGSGIALIGLIFAFAGLLLLGHEYRYNTIMYTLVNSPSRLRSFLAKVVVISVFSIVMSVFVVFFAPLCTLIGLHLHGYHLVAQQFDWWQLLWRGVFVGWGYGMFAFILVALLRNQIGAIVTFLLVPLIGENILDHIWSATDKYLPFKNLQAIILNLSQKGSGTFSTSHAVVVTLVYVVAGLLIGAVLFQKRDAN